MRTLFSDQIQEAVGLIQQGTPVAFPTETVYGLGARVFDETGIARIFQMKGRPADNPLICHIASLKQLPLLAREIPSEAKVLIEHFWPGPMTLVLKKQPAVPLSVTAGLDTVAIRMPQHPIALELIRQVGEPLVAPSANRSGKPSSTTAQHVLQDFQEMPGAVIDGGKAEIGIESTVISLAHGKPLILRLGSITKEAIAEVLNCQIDLAQGSEMKASPGTRYQHYAPQAQITLLRSLGAMDTTSSKKRFFMSTEKRQGFHHVTFSTLYALLRQADEEHCEEIILVIGEEGWNQLALRDRLLKAAGMKSEKIDP